ncbi:MAG: NADH:ubiquinone reductase (Na(+)-transporting) subunit B [Cyclobacteriaceae bacterium]
MKKFIEKKVHELRPLFEEGGKYEKLFPIYEAHETLFFQPDEVTKPKGAHIRDANDMKRLMVTVIVALIPCMLFGIWNSGYQHYLAMTPEALAAAFPNGAGPTWVDSVWFGLIRFIPILIVSYGVGLGIEFGLAAYKGHPVSEGYLVSGLLIPLTLPSTIPLWQVALATAFAVVIGKEVFGGTGMNILNPALTARAFLFFAYPAYMSGDKVWVDLDGYTGATILGDAASGFYTGVAPQGWSGFSFMDMFMGVIPGSIGETSALMCLIGAAILVITGVGSLRIMASMAVGGLLMGYVVELCGANFFGVENFYYHLVAGSFAFGAIFMATDPVSAAHTPMGKIIYGFLAGVLGILVRVLNPAYPEGIMLAILLMNVFAPLVDFYVVQANKKRRVSRATV